jgi:ADP-heptose:LPS heptosyltransferase
MSTRLNKAITIDNGIMHMMSLANIPMITLFGPTNPDKFAPKNKNIKILDSKKIYNSDDISKITEEDILNFI